MTVSFVFDLPVSVQQFSSLRCLIHTLPREANIHAPPWQFDECFFVIHAGEAKKKLKNFQKLKSKAVFGVLLKDSGLCGGYHNGGHQNFTSDA